MTACSRLAFEPWILITVDSDHFVVDLDGVGQTSPALVENWPFNGCRNRNFDDFISGLGSSGLGFAD